MVMRELQKILNNLVGLTARRVKLGYGSFITMDFGNDIEVKVKTKTGVNKHTRGEWHLWVYQCAWRIDKNDKPVVGSEDDRKIIEKLVKCIEGKVLKKFEILTDSFDAKLTFSGNIVLYLFSHITVEVEQWMLYTPGDKVLVVGPSTQWKYSSSNK